MNIIHSIPVGIGNIEMKVFVDWIYNIFLFAELQIHNNNTVIIIQSRQFFLFPFLGAFISIFIYIIKKTQFWESPIKVKFQVIELQTLSLFFY